MKGCGTFLQRQFPKITQNGPTTSRPEQYTSCRQFLSHFDGHIYTLNYDLLLYWTLMQDELKPELKSDDGFRDVEEGSADYVVWDVQNSGMQRIHYLHGALHIFDAGAELKKFVWSKTDIALVDQIRPLVGNSPLPFDCHGGFIRAEDGPHPAQRVLEPCVSEFSPRLPRTCSSTDIRSPRMTSTCWL